MLYALKEETGAMSFRLHSANIPAVMAKIKKHTMTRIKWPVSLLSTHLWMIDFNRLYQADQLTGKIFISFASFAILIACLGLFGLVTYAAEQRSKEIGIRKVLALQSLIWSVFYPKDFLSLYPLPALWLFVSLVGHE